MSARLLLCALVLGTRAADAYVTRNDAGIFSQVENKTLPVNDNGFYVYNPNRRIVVEEVDKHGNSVVKELELPDYDEPEEDTKKISQKEGRRQLKEKSTNNEQLDLYGCNSRRENQRRKCLQRKKKFLKIRYRNWKALIRHIIKDLDGKIKTIRHANRVQSTTENLNFMSGLSPKTVMRKKE